MVKGVYHLCIGKAGDRGSAISRDERSAGSALFRLISASLLIVTAPPAYSQDWERMRDIVPKHYICYRASEPVRIDGRLDDPAWTDAPWTDYFVDIEGDRRPAPRHDTRMKMLWDDDYLYFGIWMEEPHVWGTLTEKNSIIYQDNDFEIFIDPTGDNHNYYEFEINALNTIMELTMNRPYKDGGRYELGTNIHGLRSAVHVQGTLNAPHDVDTAWTVEVAIPWDGLAWYSDNPVPPVPGEQWRMNFSRVQWKHEIDDNVYVKVPDTDEDNWVWSPQGVVDMHRPERWGYVQFSEAEPETDTFRHDPTLVARELLMEVYYAQREHFRENREWSGSLVELGVSQSHHTSSAELGGIELTDEGYEVSAFARMPDGSLRTLFINQHSLLRQE